MKKLLLAVATVVSVVALGLNVSGITKAADDGYSPIFNTFTNVDGIGDEKDFLRVQNDDGTRVNTKEICSGETRLWIYVHNNRPSINNNDPNKEGDWDGVGVAHNTRVKLSLPGTYTNSTTATAKISADNAVNSPTDTAFITCGTKKVKVEYVAVESVNSNPQGNYTLTGDIMSANGATLNYKGMAGVVPGCWEYRASIVVKVKITEEPPAPKPQTLKCEAVLVNRKGLGVGVTVNGVATNGATITGYKIVWGDGSADSTKQSDTHTYADYDKQYTLKGYVKGKVDGKDTDWLTSDKCSYTFSEPAPEKPEPPVEPPTPPQPPVTPELPNTGAGSVLGIATAISALGAIGHRVWTVRRMQ